MSLSYGLKLIEDDFISPSQACVKPLAVPKAAAAAKDDADEAVALSPQQKAQISLNDCLACSGCVTSAETVLITAQSLTQVLEKIEQSRQQQQLHLVFSVSPQSRASLAARFNLPLAETHARLVGFLRRHANAAAVVDTGFSRSVSLLESLHEFLQRKQSSSSSSTGGHSRNGRLLPMLASACPGWVCYAEKRHGSYVLPYISTAKSPQQVMGTVVKRHFAAKLATTPARIFHVSVMPCFDKKLEASRDDFVDADTGARDVDCVLTTAEIVDLMHAAGVAELSDVDADADTDVELSCLLPDGRPEGPAGGSGGYADYIFRHAARALYSVDVDEVKWTAGRNRDMQTAELTDPATGARLLKFALVYGFRNIQTLVRQIKSGRCDIDYAEVMACPAGCLNGGGQIRPDAAADDAARKQLLERVDQLYHSQHIVVPPAQPDGPILDLYKRFCPDQPQPCSDQAKLLFHTAYHYVPPMEASSSIQW